MSDKSKPIRIALADDHPQHLELPGEYDQEWEMTISEAAGKPMLTRTAPKWDMGIFQLDVAVGTYILRLEGGNAVYCQKIVIVE